MSDNIVNLVEKSYDARHWNAEAMLQDALHEVRNGVRSQKKALILWLDDSDDEYLLGFTQCGMTTAECVLLCELGKDRLKQEM